MLPTTEREKVDGLERRLSLFDSVSLVIGAVIGSAIFLVPATVLGAHPSPLAGGLVFLFAGVLSWFGALAYAELGSMFPNTGGEYVYLRESWGSGTAFLCGWSYFIVTQTAGQAALAVGFSALVGSVTTLGPVTSRLCSAGLLITLTLLNIRGVRTGAVAGNLLNVCKAYGLLGVIAAALFFHDPVPIDWGWPADWTFAQLGLAMVPVLWAYEGWNLVTFVGGEVRRAESSVPKALSAGLGVVIAVYLLSLWVYLRVLTVPEIIASEAVAPAVAQRVLGGAGGTLVTITMIIALAGATNAAILAAPRLYFAQARDGLFFRSFATVHPRFRTPVTGLIFQCVWAVILSLTGSYEALLSCCMFVAWIFYAFCVAAVFKLRREMPDRPRAYKMWGYPWSGAVFIVTAVVFVVSTLVTRPWTSLAGVALMAAGLPLYWRWRRERC